MLQYHCMPARGLSPYLGAGINHTIFFDQGGNLSGYERFGPGTGAVVQAGFNYRPNPKYLINVDLAKWYIKPNLTPQGGSMIETMQLNPVTLGVSFGRYFSGTL